MRVTLNRKRILVDGSPHLVLAGEIHYFRLKRADWASRLDLLVAAGANTVASYIPWVVHEMADGTVDLTGEVRPELDLGAFIDLCQAKGLQFLARPGPFVMAELRHEGIPPRLTEQYPSLRPSGWDGAPSPTATVDYVAPDFLAEADGWYARLGPILAPRMAGVGGPVIAVQLDNEIGMLSWVSNTPDFTEKSVADFLDFVSRRYGNEVNARYPADFAAAVRAPDEATSGALRVDLAQFLRERFATYISHLAGSARRHGFGAEPLLINIHGTAHGSGLPFPIGISQLARGYAGQAGMTSGSDHYLGTLTWPAAAEVHMMHAFMDAVHGVDQPLTSLEFEAGTGDYGGDGGSQIEPSSVELKTRILLAQGVRAFNWYLFAGGTNFIDPRPGDRGTHRFGITGQRHGAAAPVTPEGARGAAYATTAQAISVAGAHASWAAEWTQELDGLLLGFVPDHYATEHVYPGNSVMPELVAELSWARGAGPRGLLPRVLLDSGFRYGAVDLQGSLPAEAAGRVIALGSPGLMDAVVQQRLLEHVRSGGGLFLFGAIPTRDLEGRPCTILADAWGVEVEAPAVSEFPSVVGDGWAVDQPEIRVGRIQFLRTPPHAQVLLREVMSGTPCAFEMSDGAGKVAVIATDYAAESAFFARLLSGLGADPGLQHDSGSGIFATTTVSPGGDRFLHVVNVGSRTQETGFTLDGQPLFDGSRVKMAPRSGRIMSLGVQFGGHRLDASTAEIVGQEQHSVILRIDQPMNHIRVDGMVRSVPSSGTHVISWTAPTD